MGAVCNRKHCEAATECKQDKKPMLLHSKPRLHQQTYSAETTALYDYHFLCLIHTFCIFSCKKTSSSSLSGTGYYPFCKMPPGSQPDDKRQAAREVLDILHEISTLLVRVLSCPGLPIFIHLHLHFMPKTKELRIEESQEY